MITEKRSTKETEIIQSVNPKTQQKCLETFFVTTEEELHSVVEKADQAWKTYKNTSGKQKATFLRTIANEIEALGEALVKCAMAESGLPEGRIVGERGRTCNQLRLFADLVEEGSWVEATVDEALPDRKPMPRVDIRKMLVALGPVAVFTASNFPLAFSTAGGDTASALAAGCPVIVKSHPSHLGTNALVAKAIDNAIKVCGLPEGVFSTINGGIKTGLSLVKRQLIQAVSFTGSYQGGKALFDVANKRKQPIPVYAEMGSNNPVFILEEKLNSEYESLARTIADSVNLGAGQFCTNPGILVLQKGQCVAVFLEALTEAFKTLQQQTMLNQNVFEGYEKSRAACLETSGVKKQFESENFGNEWLGRPAYATVSGKDFLKNELLQEEIFGPFTLIVICDDDSEFKVVANSFQGQLTTTIMATEKELSEASNLLEILSQKSGRVIFNGVPTGVEVCHAMHHGGPFPSTLNALYTSVGTDAIKRFARPVVYQNMPNNMLPDALKQKNPLDIWRTVNGEKVK